MRIYFSRALFFGLSLESNYFEISEKQFIFVLTMPSYLSKISCSTFLIVFVIAMLVGCKERDNYNAQPKSTQGYAPVYYDSLAIVNSIKILPPQPLKKNGIIHLYKTYLLIVVPDSGVHVFDNKDTTKGPIPVGFIGFSGMEDLAVKNDVLYIQSYIGLAYIDISNLPNIQVLGFFVDTTGRKGYDLLNWKLDRLGVTKNTNGRIFTECPDESKGRIIDWRLKDLVEPKCYFFHY